MNITDDKYEELVNASSGPVLIDFWAENCMPCKRLATIFEELEKELDGKIKIYKMNIQENPCIPTMLRVRAIPTMILFKNGIEKDRKIGFLPKEDITKWITPLIE